MNKKVLAINHHIFLSKEQRYQLQNVDSSVKVIGISSPIWIDNEISKIGDVVEVFCEYEIKYSKKQEKNIIQLSEKGFFISLIEKMPSYLTDIKDGGIECLMISHKNAIKKNNLQVPVLHCISIEDEEVLLKTIAETDLNVDGRIS